MPYRLAVVTQAKQIYLEQLHNLPNNMSTGPQNEALENVKNRKLMPPPLSRSLSQNWEKPNDTNEEHTEYFLRTVWHRPFSYLYARQYINS